MKMQTMNVVLVALWIATSACSGEASSGFGEPVRVYRSDGKTVAIAEFIPGPIPAASVAANATPAETTAAVGTGLDNTLPSVTQFTPPNQVVLPGQRASKVTGRLSTNSSAVALAFDTGSGYWLFPAGNPDSSSDDELLWTALCDYSPDIAPGYHELTVAAANAAGIFGTSLTKKLCIAGSTPDHLNSCESTLAPPMTVISLSWDTNVDLDLQVVPPAADRIVSSKHPTTVDRNADGTLPDEAGVIDRDSNAACAIDGIRYENLVFERVKPHGTWGIYVNLFDSCKQAAVHFTVTVHVAKSDGVNDAGTALYHLEQVGLRHGMLMATQANGDSSAIGTYLFEVSF